MEPEALYLLRVAQCVLFFSLVHERSEQENVSESFHMTSCTWLKLQNICYYYWSFIAMVTCWKFISANFDYVISFFHTTTINLLLSMSFWSAHLPCPSFLFFNLAEWPMSSSHAITFVKLWHEHPVPPPYDVLVCPIFPYTLNVFSLCMYTIS